MMRASRFPGFNGKKKGIRERKPITIDNAGLSVLEDLESGTDSDDDERVDVVDSITAPLISHDAAIEAEDGSLPQYGVFGQVLRTHAKGFPSRPEDKRLYCNINSPFTAVVCGVQGSGKSHTVSVLLESMLIQDNRLGALPSALSALVLHFGESGTSLKPCEATFVGQCEQVMVVPPDVVVFCSPSNYRHVATSYAQFGGGAKVYPLYFQEEDLDATSLLALMAVSESGQMPLYMHMVMQVISDLGESYSYTNFKMGLSTLMLEPIQARMLDQRLSLLEGFLCRKDRGKLFPIKRPKLAPGAKGPAEPIAIKQPPGGRFKQGQLTIVDLTDPFISPSAACSLFEIVLKLYNKAELKCSKVVVLDEAHKYLTPEGSTISEGSKRLTERFLSFTRQQRHLAMRVIISTQEPTVVPSSLLDLCSFIVCHRFFSAGWFTHLAKHVSSELDRDAFERVVMLDRGECLVFPPTALFVGDDSGEEHETNGQAWGKQEVTGWGNGDDRVENKVDGWSGDSDEVKAKADDSGWGQKSDSGHLAKDAKDEGEDDDGGDDDGNTDSVGSEDLDIIIEENVFEPRIDIGMSKLHIDTTSHSSSPKQDLSGWNVPLPVHKKSQPAQKQVGQLGRGYIVVKTRRRITDDGGRSILATDQL